MIEKGSDDRARAISMIENGSGKRKREGRKKEDGREETRPGPKARRIYNECVETGYVQLRQTCKASSISFNDDVCKTSEPKQ